MMTDDFKKLNLPDYEWLKALPKKHNVVRRTLSGEKFMDTEHCQYDLTLFSVPGVRGRFTLNEDAGNLIIFDLIIDGYVSSNRSYHKALRFNKKNYLAICKHAQEVYEFFQRELSMDHSWVWNRSPEEYYKIYK